MRDIVEDCGINRNSFYYHFQDIPSLVEEIITEQTDLLIQKYPSISSLDECLFVALKFAQDNRKAVMHIYNSVNRSAFEQSTMKLCESVITTYISTAFPDNPIRESDRKLVIKFMKCQLFGMCVDWVSNGMKDEAYEDLRRMTALCQGVPELIMEHSLESE